MNRPWVAALLVGTAATPPAVILAIPAPRPIDALLAWPLVLIDAKIGDGDAPRLLLGLAGIALTWVHYVLLARLFLWRLSRPIPDPERSEG
jgi:hypothetical protein